MLDEWLVILCFLTLASAAFLALRAMAVSLRTAAVTLLIAGLLTPVVWVASDAHLRVVTTHARSIDRAESFADVVLLELPMSFFVSVVLAAVLTAGFLRALRRAGALKAGPSRTLN